jgi:hypothetical protein
VHGTLRPVHRRTGQLRPPGRKLRRSRQPSLWDHRQSRRRTLWLHAQANIGFTLDFAARTDAKTDPEMFQAKSNWSNCLTHLGYHLSDPLDDLPIRGGGRASQGEIQQALADISCKESTNSTSRANAVTIRFALHARETNRIALQPSQQFNDQALQNAKAVIAKKLWHPPWPRPNKQRSQPWPPLIPAPSKCHPHSRSTCPSSSSTC